MKHFLDKYKGLLRGKKIAITGSTGGIGIELCRLLGREGAELILVDRNEKKQQSLISMLLKEQPSLAVDGILADMEDIASVKSATDKMKNIGIDYLILNAGAYSIPRHRTSLGYDNVFQINFISPYYMTRELVASVKSRGGRIIAVGSIAHGYSHTDSGDVDFSGRRKASLVYGNAKRYLMYSLLRLKEKGEPIEIAHPGITFTGITAHYPPFIFAIIKYPMKIIFMKPRKACLSIYAALIDNTRAYSWLGPRLFDVWGLPKSKILRTAKTSEIEYIDRTANEIYDKIK